MPETKSTLVFTISLLMQQARSDDEIVAALFPGNQPGPLEGYVRLLIRQLRSPRRCPGCAD